MPKFSLDLPYLLPLAEGEYSFNVASQTVAISHAIFQQADLDSRLGDVQGHFAYVRDQFGLLRYSILIMEPDIDELDGLAAAYFGGSYLDDRTWTAETYGQVALALFNQFLVRYLTATRNINVRPVRRGDLARIHVENEHLKADIYLYGRGITLPVVGLTPKAHERVVQQLAGSDDPATYEIGALDALRALEDGMASEALVLAAGSLESACDVLLARSWRLSQNRSLPKDAAKQLDVTGPDVRTIDDVLEKSAVSRKIAINPIARLATDAHAEDSVVDALEVRNLAVHGGVRVPPLQAQRHVKAMALFVLDQVATAIRRDYPQLPRPEFFYAYEEAMGTSCPSEIEEIARMYLVDAGLSAKLYNRKVERSRMFSERYGNTLVMRIAFRDFQADQINLFIARALLHHWLEQRGAIAFARVNAILPEETSRPFWSIVASEMTRAVWGAAIDRRLENLGLKNIVRQEIKREATRLKQKYGTSYIGTAFDQLEYWVGYLELSRIAAALTASERKALLQVSEGVAPEMTRRAVRALAAMESVSFDDPVTILDSLVAAHDAHEGILATVPIYDPVTQKEYGLGLNFGDIGEMIRLL